MKRRHELVLMSAVSTDSELDIPPQDGAKKRRLDVPDEDMLSISSSRSSVGPAGFSSLSLAGPQSQRGQTQLALPRLRASLLPLPLQAGIKPLLELAAFMPAQEAQSRAGGGGDDEAMQPFQQSQTQSQQSRTPHLMMMVGKAYHPAPPQPLHTWVFTTRLILHKGGAAHHHHPSSTTAQAGSLARGAGASSSNNGTGSGGVTLIAALAVAVVDVASRFVLKVTVVPMPIRPILTLLADLGGGLGTDLSPTSAVGATSAAAGKTGAPASSPSSASLPHRNHSAVMLSAAGAAGNGTGTGSVNGSSGSLPAMAVAGQEESQLVNEEEESPCGGAAAVSPWASSCIKAFAAAVLLSDRGGNASSNSSGSGAPHHLLRYSDPEAVNAVAGQLIQTFTQDAGAASSFSAPPSAPSAAPTAYSAAALALLGDSAREEAALALISWLDAVKEGALSGARASLQSFYRSVSSLSAQSSRLPTHPFQVLSEEDMLLSSNSSSLSSGYSSIRASAAPLGLAVARDFWSYFCDRLGHDIVSSLAAVSAEPLERLGLASQSATGGGAGRASTTMPPPFLSFVPPPQPSSAPAAFLSSLPSSGAADAGHPPYSSLAVTPTPTLQREYSATGEILGPRLLGLKLEELPSSSSCASSASSAPSAPGFGFAFGAPERGGAGAAGTGAGGAGAGFGLPAAFPSQWPPSFAGPSTTALLLRPHPQPMGHLTATGAVGSSASAAFQQLPLQQATSSFLIPQKSADAVASAWNVTAIGSTSSSSSSSSLSSAASRGAGAASSSSLQLMEAPRVRLLNYLQHHNSSGMTTGAPAAAMMMMLGTSPAASMPSSSSSAAFIFGLQR